MKDITYIRPSGTEITVADTPANKQAALSNGWKVKPDTPAKDKDK